MTLEGLYYELNNINDDMLTYEDIVYDDRKSFILDSISMSSKYKEWNDSDGDRINSCCTGTGQRTKKNSIDTFDKLIDRICRSTARNERSSLYKFIRTRDIHVKDIIRRIHTSSYLIKSKLIDRLDVSDSFKLNYSKAICTTKHEVLYKFFTMLLNHDLSNYIWSFAICDFITDYGLVQGSSTLPANIVSLASLLGYSNIRENEFEEYLDECHGLVKKNGLEYGMIVFFKQNDLTEYVELSLRTLSAIYWSRLNFMAYAYNYINFIEEVPDGDRAYGIMSRIIKEVSKGSSIEDAFNNISGIHALNEFNRLPG